MAKWFSTKASAAGKAAEITIFNDIGYGGVTTADFYDALRAIGDVEQINVLIQSHGGDVSTGFAIYDILARHPARVVVRVVGLAASMASVIAMAGDEVVMPENARMMVHNPWGQVEGDAKSISSFAEALGSMGRSIQDAYIARTGLTRDEVAALMDAETWLTAERAVALGFADRVEPALAISAKFDLSRFAKAPKNFAAQSKKESAMTTKTTENEGSAETGAAKTEDEIRKEVIANHREIRSLCKLAGREDLADKYIDDGLAIGAVITALAALAAEDEKAAPQISARNNSASEGAAKLVDTSAIFNRFNSAGKRR